MATTIIKLPMDTELKERAEIVKDLEDIRNSKNLSREFETAEELFEDLGI